MLQEIEGNTPWQEACSAQLCILLRDLLELSVSIIRIWFCSFNNKQKTYQRTTSGAIEVLESLQETDAIPKNATDYHSAWFSFIRAASDPLECWWTLLKSSHGLHHCGASMLKVHSVLCFLQRLGFKQPLYFKIKVLHTSEVFHTNMFYTYEHDSQIWTASLHSLGSLTNLPVS